MAGRPFAAESDLSGVPLPRAMKFVGGRVSGPLAQKAARLAGVPIVETECKTFPDGEIYVRIPRPLEGEVAIFNSTVSSEALVELILLGDAARGQGARHLTAVVPYYGYSRQDRRFKEGEALSAQAIARAIGGLYDRLLLVDPHKEAILDFFPQGAVRSDTAVPELAQYLKDKGVDLFLAPDEGALDRARRAAEITGADHDFLEKTRIDANTVQITAKSLDVEGRTVAILDDIISTGGTMATACRHLAQQGATAVHAACTHGLFTEDARDRLKRAGFASIVATDTIPGQYSQVSAAHACVRGLEQLVGKKVKMV